MVLFPETGPVRRAILLGRGIASGALLLALAACYSDALKTVPPSEAVPVGGSNLSLVARVGQKAFFDKNLSGGRNMSCANCHDPQYAYGPPNSLAVQLGSDPKHAGERAVPSLRYKESTPAYDDNAANPDGVSSASAGGGFMWDGRAATMAAQVALPLLNPVEMNGGSKAAVVQAVRSGAYADLFKQAFGAAVFGDTDRAFDAIGTAIEAFEREDISFHPYSSKYDLYVFNKIGGKLTPAEMRGQLVFHSSAVANCSACHYAGVNFAGNTGLMSDFTFQALGAPRNDRSIPGNPDPIPANDDPKHYDMGLCGPYRTDHAPDKLGTPDPYCGQFKVPVLRNVATRGAFFHNGVFHSLTQVLEFYNTRDTHPEYWYPATGGRGTLLRNPTWALQPTYVPGATVAKFNDLPLDEQGSIDEQVPMGTGIAPADKDDATTLGEGVKPRAVGSAPAISEQDIADLICFLGTLSDGYKPPKTPPTSGACVN